MIMNYKLKYDINMNWIKLFSIALCFMASMAHAQTRQIQGTVKDQQGPVPGMSVIEKEIPGNGTVTDNEGRFRLTLKGKSAIIVVKGVGYLPREVLASSGNLMITISADEKTLEDVVVVGYGQQKKITLTGAASTISGKEIRQNPSASLQNTLAGRVSGYTAQQRSGQPGSDGAQFFIRGQSSFTGNNQPLIIVDDIEFTYDQFARIDANEVESVTILKDASTTAIYGIKGANGVVVVTTRRGKIGKPTVTFRSDYSLNQPTTIPKFLDSYHTALLYNQAQINDNMYSATPNPNFQPRFSATDLELFQNGTDPYGHPNVDWRKELFKKFSQQTKGNLDVSGGTEKVKYFVSVGYLNQGGNTKDYSEDQGYNGKYYYNRYNYRSNLDMSITKSLDLRMDLYGNVGEINKPNIYQNSTAAQKNDVFYEYGSFLALSPFAYPIKNPDGSWGYSNWQKSEAGGGTYNGGNIIQRLAYDGYNRIYENNMNLVTSAVQRLDFITPGLSLKGTLSYASSHRSTTDLTRTNLPSFIYNVANDTYEPRDPNVFRLERLGTNYNAGSTVRNVTVQAIANYDRTFGLHHVSGLALFSQNSVTQTQKDAAGNIDANYNFIPANTRGYTARIGYDYKQKYLIQFSGAYNGTDRFVAAKRFGFFPAASAGWNISEEPFFKNNIKFIDYLKLRSSYGLVGSDNLGGFTYAYLQTYTQNNGSSWSGVAYPEASFGTNHNIFNGIQEGQLSNNNVTWEKQRELNFGVDFKIFKNRLSGTVEYFKNNRYDILTTRGTISAVFGQTLPPVNLGRTENKGIEIELNYNDKIGQDFNYFAKATYSLAKNKILFMDETSQEYPWQYLTGHPIGSRLSYTFLGFYKDLADVAASPKVTPSARPGDLKYADLNGDNIIDSKDQSVVGYPNMPNTNLGLSFGFSYKHFNVNVLFQSALNFNVRGYEEAIRAFSSNLTSVHQNSWTPELGDRAQYPLISLQRGVSDPGTYVSDFWYLRGDYVRLKNAEIGYTFSDQLLKRLKIQNLRLYLTGNNLLTWSKAFNRYAFDPEINSGTDRVNYPPERMYNLGLSVTF